jgi:hypothetical protein
MSFSWSIVEVFGERLALRSAGSKDVTTLARDVSPVL